MAVGLATRRCGCLLAFTLLIPSAEAQWAASRNEAGAARYMVPASPPDSGSAERDAVPRMALRGGAAGAVAIAAGWAGGMAMFDSYEAAVLTAAVFGTFAIPIAVHVANDSRGELPFTVAASVGALVTAGAVYLLAARLDDSLGAAWLVVPVTQLAASIWTERAAR
jgi:hypothetical protein